MNRKPTSIRLVDPDTGEGTWYPLETINHELKLLRKKEVFVNCARCKQPNVWLCEAHIQYGFAEDKHWEYVYCSKCEIVTLHIFTVKDEENG